MLTVEGKLVAHEVLVLVVGWCLGLSYAGDGMAGLRDPEWIQGSINMLINLFHKY